MSGVSFFCVGVESRRLLPQGHRAYEKLLRGWVAGLGGQAPRSARQTAASARHMAALGCPLAGLEWAGLAGGRRAGGAAPFATGLAAG